MAKKPSDPKDARRQMTTLEFVAMKQRGERIAVLTAYDYLMAGLLDEAGVDCVLVGDSLGQVVAGEESTLPVTIEQMIYHAN
jgi:3-methyl-2-oxobutanoate hydroxymethyltransferase